MSSTAFAETAECYRLDALRQLDADPPGAHSELVKAIAIEFAPRFAPEAKVIYVGDTGVETGHLEQQRLADPGVTIDRLDKTIGLVLYLGATDWLLLVNSVTSHGPVNTTRHHELMEFFDDATPGFVCVSAFPNRAVMTKCFDEISLETVVWVEALTYLIHFHGERFLEPFERVDQ